MDRNDRQKGPDTQPHAPAAEAPAPRRLSPAAQMQRSVGNARLLQLRARRAAVQRQDLFDAARADAAARMAAREQATLEQSAAQVSIPSGGVPLSPAVQARAEQHLGVPMGDVRVVHGADSATDPLQAHAFATEDGGAPKVVMSSGVDLSSRDGQFTLMHELTHVAQQKKGLSSGLSGLGGDERLREDLEQHADHHAEKMCADPGHKH